MRKRERENPCGVCGHYHKYEEGEVCGICGHRMPVVTDKSTFQVSAFPSEILPEFLYLGSYDNASRAELLKTLGISRILNTRLWLSGVWSCINAEIGSFAVKLCRKYCAILLQGIISHQSDNLRELKNQTVPACQNLYKNSFTYHCLQHDQILAFDDAIQFLEQCERDRARVLVHCMSGKNRSPAIVIAYLMKSKGWRLSQSYQWVKERRPSVEINQAIYQQLQDYEQKLFGAIENNISALPSFSPSGLAPFSFGIAKPHDTVPVPAFNSGGSPSIFARPNLDVPPQEFTFGAGPAHTNMPGPPFGANPDNPNNSDVAMD